MDTRYTIFVEGPAAADAAFENELASSAGGTVKRNKPRLSALQTAHDICSFVVNHEAEIKTAFELTAAAVKVVAGLIGLAERRKVKMTLVASGRQITIEAGRRADLEAMMGVILRKSQPIPENVVGGHGPKANA